MEPPGLQPFTDVTERFYRVFSRSSSGFTLNVTAVPPDRDWRPRRLFRESRPYSCWATVESEQALLLIAVRILYRLLSAKVFLPEYVFRRLR